MVLVMLIVNCDDIFDSHKMYKHEKAKSKHMPIHTWILLFPLNGCFFQVNLGQPISPQILFQQRTSGD